MDYPCNSRRKLVLQTTWFQSTETSLGLLTSKTEKTFDFLLLYSTVVICHSSNRNEIETLLKKKFRWGERILTFLFKTYFIDYAIKVSPIFCPFILPLPCTPQPSRIPPLASCPWVVHIGSLTSLFLIPFLTSSHIFYAYQLCFLFPVPLYPYSFPPLPH